MSSFFSKNCPSDRKLRTFVFLLSQQLPPDLSSRFLKLKINFIISQENTNITYLKYLATRCMVWQSPWISQPRKPKRGTWLWNKASHCVNRMGHYVLLAPQPRKRRSPQRHVCTTAFPLEATRSISILNTDISQHRTPDLIQAQNMTHA